MEVPCARIATQTDDIASALEYKKNNQYYPNYGGSWGHGGNLRTQVNNARVGQLEIVRSIKYDYKDTIRIRVEEPWVQFYAETEDELRVIASRFDDDCKSRLLSISVPEDDAHAELLKAGDIITKTDNGFKYKVFVRDGLYSHESKMQIMNYLDGLGSDMQISKGARKHLEGPLSYVWGVYFYINDASAMTFLSLIHPRAIRKIHRLVPVNE